MAKRTKSERARVHNLGEGGGECHYAWDDAVGDRVRERRIGRCGLNHFRVRGGSLLGLASYPRLSTSRGHLGTRSHVLVDERLQLSQYADCAVTKHLQQQRPTG